MPISRANEFEALINDENKEHCQTFSKNEYSSHYCVLKFGFSL